MISKSIIGKEIATKLEVPQKRGLRAAVGNIPFEMIREGLAKGEKVVIRGFGTFSIVKRKAREGRNPHTGEKIQIAASTTVSFRTAGALRDALTPKPPARMVGGERNALPLRRA